MALENGIYLERSNNEWLDQERNTLALESREEIQEHTKKKSYQMTDRAAQFKYTYNGNLGVY